MVTVVAALPAGAGLGSSAAYSVCLAASLLCHTHAIGRPTSSEAEISCSELPEPLPSRLRACGVWSGPGRGWSKGERDLINKWGYQAERLIHGKPSGIDNSISTFGELIQTRGLEPARADGTHVSSYLELQHQKTACVLYYTLEKLGLKIIYGLSTPSEGACFEILNAPLLFEIRPC